MRDHFNAVSTKQVSCFCFVFLSFFLHINGICACKLLNGTTAPRTEVVSSQRDAVSNTFITLQKKKEEEEKVWLNVRYSRTLFLFLFFSPACLATNFEHFAHFRR